MHRYLLFAGDEINANGGWDDYICSWPSIDECVALCKWTRMPLGFILHVDHKDWQTDSFLGHWVHVVDIRTGEKVYQMTSFKMKQDEKEKRDTS